MKACLCLAVALILLGGVGRFSPTHADSTQPASVQVGEDERLKKEEAQAGRQSGLTRYDLGIWTLVVFALLFILLGKYAWGPIMQGLDKREQTLTSYHSEAEKARAEAEKYLLEIKAQRAKAHEEMAALIAAARRDADAFRESEKTRTAAEIQTERERLKREIETARDQALAEIWDKTVQLATLVSSKVIGRSVTADDHRRLVDESLHELNQGLTKA